MIRKYGYIPALKDRRDYKFKLLAPIILPSVVDMRPNDTDIYDQGQLGSCTGNAISGAIRFDLKKQGKPDIIPSRLFIYYNERVIENSVDSDAGAQIKDGIKAVNTYGVCSEIDWPYDISQFTVKPPDLAYNDAKQDLIERYEKLDDSAIQLWKQCLAQGFPFVFGFTVYSGFESTDVATTGILKMPTSDEDMMGGHAVMCLGYDDSIQSFIIRNSWGASWGDKGYFYMPYDYMQELASDRWVIYAA